MNFLTDHFIRADQAGWGIGPQGQSYASYDGSPTLNILTNRGEIQTAANMESAVSISSLKAFSIDYTQSFTQTNGKCGITWKGNGSTFYEASVEDPTNSVMLRAHINGFVVDVVPPVYIKNYLSGVDHSIRVDTDGLNISIYAWPSKSSPPKDPVIKTTDSFIVQSGMFGPYCVNYAASPTFIDYYTVTYQFSEITSIPLLPTAYLDTVAQTEQTLAALARATIFYFSTH